MANERLIKQRIKSAKNIAQITKAMQMVAASKMRKAQVAAVSGRPYAEKIAEAVQLFVKKIDQNKHPLLAQREKGKRLIVVITSNKGLCGGLNTNLFRYLMSRFTTAELENSVFANLGKKSESFLVRSKLQLVADFSEGKTFSENLPALTTFITNGFVKGEFNEVFMVYNNFESALSQVPTSKQLLPIAQFSAQNEVKDKKENEQTQQLEFLVEPSIDAILDELLFHYVENQIRDAVLEAEASEHSARMIAMKNATDNANDFVGLLTLEYNKARQEKITYEIADMITARLAVEG